MLFGDSFDKNNLHHSYLLEGEKDLLLSQVLELMKDIKVEVIANPDFRVLSFDSIKIDDARNIKKIAEEKSFSDSKRVFVVTANSILLEAQNSLLKIFEEPINNTHFFVLLPSVSNLLHTFVSRFFVLKEINDLDTKEVEKFVKSNLLQRIDFIKDLLKTEKEEENFSSREKALDFLNKLELYCSKNLDLLPKNKDLVRHLLKTRKYLRQPGSATKTLLESVALSVPIY